MNIMISMNNLTPSKLDYIKEKVEINNLKDLT
jgi:hypothetical protein